MLFLELRNRVPYISYTNCDIPGGDYTYVTHVTKEMCASFCALEDRDLKDCSHFVWAPLGGLDKCHLKRFGGRKVDLIYPVPGGLHCGVVPSRIKE